MYLLSKQSLESWWYSNQRTMQADIPKIFSEYYSVLIDFPVCPRKLGERQLLCMLSVFLQML